jgi:ribosomal protein S18 acetylase RimI-like enzyme
VQSTTWIPLKKDREGAAAMVAAAESGVRHAGRALEAAGLAALQKRILEEEVEGGVLLAAPETVFGVAFWETVGQLGRRVQAVVLASDRQNPEGWTRFLNALLDLPDPGGPVFLLDCGFPGLTDSEAAALLVPRGFRVYHRYGLEFPAGAPLPSEPSQPLLRGRLRNVGPADLDGLAMLNAAAYAHSVDRYRFTSGHEPVEDARRLLRSLFEGKYGAFLPESSFGLEIDGALRGATLVTDRVQYKLIADVEVHPDFQRHGHARRLLRAMLAATPRDGKIPLVLTVTKENNVAFELYLRLGFISKEGPFPLWADSARLGLLPPAQ